jgi:ABC-type lipoprotein release transport system permease subunit
VWSLAGREVHRHPDLAVDRREELIMFKLAWRNLWRNRTRTLIVGSAIVFSYALMLISLGINDDLHAKMLDSASVAVGGEVLVHGQGWWETQSSDIVIDKSSDIEAALEQTAGVEAVIPRVIINGLLTSSRGNEAVRLTGVDLEREKRLRDVAEHLETGQFFSTEFDSPLVLSTGLAKKLGVERGDKVVLTASTPEGEVTRALFRLDGTIETAGGAAEMQAYTSIDAAQTAVSMPGKLTQFGVLTSEGVPHEQVARHLRDQHLRDQNSRGSGGDGSLEVLTWEQAAPEMVGFIEMDDAFGMLYMIIVFIVVVFAIANTFLMAVMERVRELGLLNAIGMSPKKIGSLVFWETGLLAVLALLVGLAIALGAHFYIAEVGIDLAQLTAEDMELAGVNIGDMVMRSQINPVKWLTSTGLVFVAVMLSAAYPAWRATNLAPAEAMRFYE